MQFKQCAVSQIIIRRPTSRPDQKVTLSEKPNSLEQKKAAIVIKRKIQTKAALRKRVHAAIKHIKSAKHRQLQTKQAITAENKTKDESLLELLKKNDLKNNTKGETLPCFASAEKFRYHELFLH